MSPEAAGLLTRAADLIVKPGGWCQRGSGDVARLDGPHDAYGALEALMLGDGWKLGDPTAHYWEARNALQTVVGDAMLSAWNDAPSMSARKVAAAMRAAAVLEAVPA